MSKNLIKPIIRRNRSVCPICGKNLCVRQDTVCILTLNDEGEEIDTDTDQLVETGICECGQVYYDESHYTGDNYMLRYDYFTDGYIIVRDPLIRNWIDDGFYKKG